MTQKENNLLNNILTKIVPEKELQSLSVKKFLCECIKMVQLYARKNHDYGNSFEVGMKRIGLPYGAGRLLDKMNRILTLMEVKAAVTDESILDSITDLGCYSIMTTAYINSLNSEYDIIDVDVEKNNKENSNKSINRHLYIIDYCNAKIYHTMISKTVMNVNYYIHENFDFDERDIYYMTSDEKVNIEEL